MSDSSLQGPIPPSPPPISSRRVRLWHFIVLPALTMAVALLVSRVVEAQIGNELGPTQTDLFHALRTILISLLMASSIAWLAVHYRRQYEVQLHARALDLEQTRDFLSGIIEGSGEAIVALDAEDRVTSWNRAAEAIFGWTSEEMRGRGPDILLPDDHRIVDDRRRMGRLIREGQTVRDHETIRVRKDGSHVAVRITWSPLYDTDGSYAGCTAIVLDITVENEMRRRLLERERLAAVGELSAQVAHEIRNPLAGIRGACQVIFSGKEDPDVRREVGEEVLRQIDRLNRTVEELLQFAKPRSIDPTPTDINELIDRVWGVLQEDPKIGSLNFERRYGSDLPPLKVDAGQIEQVLYNILLNASQVMDYQGSITVTTEMGDGDVTIAVQDTGPGIASEVADDIFKPFFSTRARGTGLGLAIVKKIVLAHDGRIEAATAPEGGAEFRIVLPVATAKTA